ncbi:MAG: hypothetical protein GY861_18545 [bacterium]|nr:hypothetical protein [bacterium]
MNKEILHEQVHEYCNGFCGTNDDAYYHEMINDESKRDNDRWKMFMEYIEDGQDTSNCCGAGIMCADSEGFGLCSDCKEHCGPVIEIEKS